MRRLVGVMLVGLLFVGCGGGGDDDEATDGVQAAADTSDDADGTDTTDGADEADRDDGDDGDGATAAGVFTSADCMQAIQAISAAYSAAGLAMSGQTEEIEKTQKEFDALARKAPDDIRSDIEILREAYGEYGRIIRESGWKPGSGSAPPQAVMDDFEKASENLDSDEVKKANANVESWFEDECGS